MGDLSIGFINDDWIQIMTMDPQYKTPPIPLRCFYLHRRFPEWWWGHFYRPEVWLALIFGIATLVSLFKTRARTA